MKTQRSSLIASVAALLAFAGEIAAQLRGRLCIVNDVKSDFRASTKDALNVESVKRTCEARAKVESDIKAILDKAKDEKRACNAEERSQIEALVTESNALRDHKAILESREEIVDRVNDAEGQEREFQAHNDPLGKKPKISAETRDLAFRGWMLNQRDDWRQHVDDEHRNAAKLAGVDLDAKGFQIKLLKGHESEALFRNYQRNGGNFTNSLDTTTGTTGGYLVAPSSLLGPLEIAKKASGGIARRAQVIRTASSGEYPWPTFNDTSNSGYRVGQKKSAGTAANPVIRKMILRLYKYTTGVLRLTHESIRDSMVDIAGLMGQAFGERLGRAQNTDWVNGNGADNPYGILKRARIGVTCASATVIDPDELITLVHKIDPAYRVSCQWMMSDACMLAIRLIQDTTGQYIFRPGLDAGQPDRILTYPVEINQDYDEVAASGDVATFGDHSYYKIREQGSIRIATDKDIDTDEELFCAYIESDGNLLDPSNGGVLCPVQRLKMHA